MTNLDLVKTACDQFVAVLNKYLEPEYIAVDSVTDETDLDLNPHLHEYYIAEFSFPIMPQLPNIQYCFIVNADSTAKLYDPETDESLEFESLTAALFNFVADFAFNTPHD